MEPRVGKEIEFCVRHQNSCSLQSENFDTKLADAPTRIPVEKWSKGNLFIGGHQTDANLIMFVGENDFGANLKLSWRGYSRPRKRGVSCQLISN